MSGPSPISEAIYTVHTRPIVAVNADCVLCRLVSLFFYRDLLKPTLLSCL